MRRKGILLVVAVLLGTFGTAQAQEDELGITLDVTYLSSYIWRGIDKYAEGHSAIQSSINVDLYGTGFGLKVLNSRANGSGFENSEELDVTLYYGDSLFEGETYVTNCTTGWVYYNYPDEHRKAADIQEVFASFSWPELCPMGFVPSYSIIRMWPARSSSDISGAGGWIHVFGLGYDLTVPGLLPETTEQVINLSAAAVYNDGAAAVGVDHDWSHAVFGASTSVDIADNLTLTPGIYYQASMDDSVNDDDETWCSVSLTYKF